MICGLEGDYTKHQCLNISEFRGPRGEGGATGATGADGEGGPRGEGGADGEGGTDGADGATGADGTDGADGATGADGEGGTDGATGPRGEGGATGATGPRGDIGPRGATGADGATGATGATGPRGATGGGTGAYLLEVEVTERRVGDLNSSYQGFFPLDDINMETLISSSSSDIEESVTIDGITYPVYYSHQTPYSGSSSSFMNIYVGLYKNGQELKLILLQPGGDIGQDIIVQKHIIAVDLQSNSNNCWDSININLWADPGTTIDDSSINDVSNYTYIPVSNFFTTYCVSDIQSLTEYD